MSRGEPRDDEFVFQDSAVHIAPADYLGCCERGWLYVDPRHGKWTLLLHWTVFSDEGFAIAAEGVCQWLNLGSIDRPPSIKRGRKYFSAWLKAAGRQPAQKRIIDMTPNVFLNRLARVRVADSKGALPHSKVIDVLSWETGIAQSFNPSNLCNQPNHLNDPNELRHRAGIVKTPSWTAAYKKLTTPKKVKTSTLAGAEGKQPTMTRTGAVLNTSPQRHPR